MPSPPCVFCEIVAGRAPASVVFRDDRSMCFMGIRPSSPGECMVIPLSHIDHVTDLDEDLAAHLMRVAHRVGRRMREAFLPQRVGYVVHGYGVAHAHLLIVPQHGPHDITSGKFARVHAGEVVFSLDGVPVTPRETLDRQAQMLRIDGPGVPQQGTH